MFTDPWLLVLLPVYGLFLVHWLHVRRLGDDVAGLLRRHSRRWLALQVCAAVALILAAAGLQISSGSRRLDVVITADVSRSIYDLDTQTQQLQALLRALPAEESRAAVVVFGAQPATERNWTDLLIEPTPAAARKTASRQATSTGMTFDLQRLTVQVDRNDTNLPDALNFSRNLLSNSRQQASRGLLLLSDFRSTRGNPEAAAAALAGSGIDLLVTPAVLANSADVQLVDIRVPDETTVGRRVPIEVTVQAQQPGVVRVDLQRHNRLIEAQTLELKAEHARGDFRKTVRFIDTPETPGIATYTARVTGPQGNLPNDVSINNTLSAAVKINAPALWAVLTRPGSTLQRLGTDPSLPLGVKTTVFLAGQFPARAANYDAYTGILLDGLTARELPNESAALTALEGAVNNGKGLLALGGTAAFGAGQHPPAGTLERILPVEMQPEDDRTRAILFVLDISSSMARPLLSGDSSTRKIDFATDHLAQAVKNLQAQDRVGLVTFAGSARRVVELANATQQTRFYDALNKIKLDVQTDLLAALEEAKRTLAADNSEEQIVVLISDGEQTGQAGDEQILAAARELCPDSQDAGKPRRTRLYTFGIGTGEAEANTKGEKLMQDLATAGGATFSRNFLKLGQRLKEEIVDAKRDYYIRRELFNAAKTREHPLLAPLNNWPDLPFRNRVKAKPQAEVLLSSARSQTDPKATVSRMPDPLVVLSGAQWPGAARRAVLALPLDGAEGAALLGHADARRLLPALIDWVEGSLDSGVPGWTITTDTVGGALRIDARAIDPTTTLPINGRRPEFLLAALHSDGAQITQQLLPVAPGKYRAEVPLPEQAVYRLTLRDAGSTLHERLIAMPYAAEFRGFGTDREAMVRLAQQAGGGSRVIERSVELLKWADEKAASRTAYALRPWLLGLGLALLLLEIASRGRRAANP